MRSARCRRKGSFSMPSCGRAISRGCLCWPIGGPAGLAFMRDLAQGGFFMLLLHDKRAERPADRVADNSEAAQWFEAPVPVRRRIVPVHRKTRPLRIDREGERRIGSPPVFLLERNCKNGDMSRGNACRGLFLVAAEARNVHRERAPGGQKRERERQKGKLGARTAIARCGRLPVSVNGPNRTRLHAISPDTRVCRH